MLGVYAFLVIEPLIYVPTIYAISPPACSVLGMVLLQLGEQLHM